MNAYERHAEDTTLGIALMFVAAVVILVCMVIHDWWSRRRDTRPKPQTPARVPVTAA